MTVQKLMQAVSRDRRVTDLVYSALVVAVLVVLIIVMGSVMNRGYGEMNGWGVLTHSGARLPRG